MYTKEENAAPSKKSHKFRKTNTNKNSMPWFQKNKRNKTRKDNSSKSFEAFVKKCWLKLTARKELFPDEVVLSNFPEDTQNSPANIESKAQEQEQEQEQETKQSKRLDLRRNSGKINLLEESKQSDGVQTEKSTSATPTTELGKNKNFKLSLDTVIKSVFSIFEKITLFFVNLRDKFPNSLKFQIPSKLKTDFLSKFLKKIFKPKNSKSLYYPFEDRIQSVEQEKQTVAKDSKVRRKHFTFKDKFSKTTCKKNPKSTRKKRTPHPRRLDSIGAKEARHSV